MQNEEEIVQEILANLRIQNPCPMILARMRGEVDEEYYCNSCDKTITDFRDCSDEEIVQKMREGTSCGIFYEDQLGGQHSVHYNFWQKAAFYALVIFSFIGFNVKPLNAQTVADTSKQIPPPVQASSNKIDSTETIIKTPSTCNSSKEIKTIKIGWRKQRVIMTGKYIEQ